MVDDLVSRLPIDWQSLFRWLAIDTDKADIIYNNMMFSKYGCRPNWGDLLKSLVVEDPCIEGEKLLFKPRLFLLNDHLQKQFLSFLVKHCNRIPDVYTQHFVYTLSHYIWSSPVVYDLFKQLAVATKIEVTEACMKDKHREMVKPATTVTESDVGTKPDSDVIVIDEDDVSEQPDKINTDSEEGKQSTKRARLESDEIEHSAKQLRLHESEANQPLSEHNISDSTNSKFEYHNGKQMVDNEVVINAQSFEQTENKANTHERVHSLALSLKDIWINIVREIPQSVLMELTTLSVHEIESVCHLIEFSSMTEDSLCTVCEHVMSTWDSFSYAAGVCLLRNILLDRISTLTEKASRQFSQTIITVAKKSKKQYVDSVMVPGFKSTSEMSSFKLEIYISITQESLSSGTRLYLLQQLLASPLTLTESEVILIQCIIDCGCDFNEVVFQNLLDVLLVKGSEFSKNLKFGKFLLSLTNKHGKDFKSLELLEKVINFHNTFFKKTLITSLKKIRSYS